MPRGELPTELIACLRQARKSRRPRARGADRWGTIPNMVSIHMRPPEIEDRVMLGHWEGDLIKGARNASAVGTLVERSTLFVALAKMDHATAATAVTGFGTVLNRINAQRRLSLTYDRGRKMAKPERLAEMIGTPSPRSTSPTRTVLGSAASTRTPTARLGSISRSEQTSPVSLKSS